MHSKLRLPTGVHLASVVKYKAISVIPSFEPQVSPPTVILQAQHSSYSHSFKLLHKQLEPVGLREKQTCGQYILKMKHERIEMYTDHFECFDNIQFGWTLLLGGRPPYKQYARLAIYLSPYRMQTDPVPSQPYEPKRHCLQHLPKSLK